jgi:hypothetical protein
MLWFSHGDHTGNGFTSFGVGDFFTFGGCVRLIKKAVKTLKYNPVSVL